MKAEITTKAVLTDINLDYLQLKPNTIIAVKMPGDVRPASAELIINTIYNKVVEQMPDIKNVTVIAIPKTIEIKSMAIKELKIYRRYLDLMLNTILGRDMAQS